MISGLLGLQKVQDIYITSLIGRAFSKVRRMATEPGTCRSAPQYVVFPYDSMLEIWHKKVNRNRLTEFAVLIPFDL
jgi:hypothetical protein